jgi:pyruvate/2-oxoglutarate dehydrogenase complex dihydrolipoamide acyltransferase (E2) component
MNLKNWFKLTFGVVLLGLFCFGLIVYENNSIATVGASSATLLLPSYSVGAEYNGMVTKQYVNVGDSVSAGQKLFEIRSDQLTSELASGTLSASSINYTPASDGGFIIAATRSGVISQINSLAGSFVTAGSPIAVITATSGASVRANFDLSGPQYNKVEPSTPVVVSLGGSAFQATITGITQESVGGHTMTVVDANMPPINKSQTIYANGTPAAAKLILNSNTLYERLLASMRSWNLVHL